MGGLFAGARGGVVGRSVFAMAGTGLITVVGNFRADLCCDYV
jgi:hypothetical protein